MASESVKSNSHSLMIPKRSAPPSYINLIRDFWQLCENKALRPTDAVLYLYLIEICNRASWQQPFCISNKKLALVLELSEKTIIDARARLADRGLIQFSKGIRNCESPSYLISALQPTDHLQFNCKNLSRNVDEKSVNRRRNVSNIRLKTKTKDYIVSESSSRAQGKCRLWIIDFFDKHPLKVEYIQRSLKIDSEKCRELALEVADDWDFAEKDPLQDPDDIPMHLLNTMRIKLHSSLNQANHEPNTHSNSRNNRKCPRTGPPSTSKDCGLIE